MPVLFYLQAIMDYKKKEGVKKKGWEGEQSQNHQLHPVVSRDGWVVCCFNMFWPAPARVT